MGSLRVIDDFPAVAAKVRELTAAVVAATGADPLGDEALRALDGRGTPHDRGFLATGADHNARAYAHLLRHHEQQYSVEVAAIDAAAAARVLDAAVAAVGAAGGGHLTLWAHGAGVDSDALADRVGFGPERDLLQLRVALPLPDPARWPDGTTVRAFRPGENDEAWLTVNNRAFADHPEQGGWTRDTLRSRMAEPWFDAEGFLVAFDADGLAGFCWTKVHPAHPPREPAALGEIYAIAADPSRHGRGLGRALTIAGLASLAARGITVGMLYVDGANTAAVGLYRALGFTDHRIDRAYGRDVAAGNPS